MQISHKRFITKMPNCLKGQTYSLQRMLYPVNSLETCICNDQEMVSGDRYMENKMTLRVHHNQKWVGYIEKIRL